jgi:hypothetical protein
LTRLRNDLKTGRIGRLPEETGSCRVVSLYSSITMLQPKA